MDNIHTIFIKDIIGSQYAISMEKAKILHDLLEKAINEKTVINISFKEIDVLITAFINNAYGLLYKNHSPEDIDSYLKFIDLKDIFKKTIDNVKEVAVSYYIIKN